MLQSMTRTQQSNNQATTRRESCQRGLSARDVQPQISKRRLMQNTRWAHKYNCDATAFDCKLQPPHNGGRCQFQKSQHDAHARTARRLLQRPERIAVRRRSLTHEAAVARRRWYRCGTSRSNQQHPGQWDAMTACGIGMEVMTFIDNRQTTRQRQHRRDRFQCNRCGMQTDIVRNPFDERRSGKATVRKYCIHRRQAGGNNLLRSLCLPSRQQLPLQRLNRFCPDRRS